MENAASKAVKQAASWYESTFGAMESPVEEMKKSKLVLSNVYKKAPGLVIGGAAGAVLGYVVG